MLTIIALLHVSKHNDNIRYIGTNHIMVEAAPLLSALTDHLSTGWIFIIISLPACRGGSWTKLWTEKRRN